jgi:hypothetical protein
VLWWITCREQAIAVTTAPTWTQVERVLWGEIRPPVGRRDFSHHATSGSAVGPLASVIS